MKANIAQKICYILLLFSSILHTQIVYSQEAYSIQVALEKNYTPTTYSSLSDLGFIGTKKVAAGTKVMLRSYLNKTTANKILQQVKARGFKDATVVFSHTLSSSKPAYMVQLGVYSSLNMKRFAKAKATFTKRHVYAQYNGGKYKVYLGHYHQRKTAESAKNILSKKGIKGFLKNLGKSEKTIDQELAAKKIAAEKAKVEKQAQVKKEAEEKAKAEKEARAAKEIEDKAKKEAALKQKKALEKKIKAKKDLKAKTKKEIAKKELQLKKAAAKAKKAAEAKKKAAALAKIKAEQEAIAKKEAEQAAIAKKEAEQAAIAKKEAEERAKMEIHKKSILRKYQEVQAMKEAEAKRKNIEAEKARRIAEAKKRVAEEKARKIAEAKKKAAEEKARKIAEEIRNRPPPYLAKKKVYPYTFHLIGIEDHYHLNISQIKIFWKKRLVQSIRGIHARVPVSEKDRCLIFEDVNFDGARDLRLMQYLPAGPNVPYFYWLFNRRRKQFLYNYPLESIDSPQIDKVNKQIITHKKINSFTYHKNYYKFYGKHLTLIKQEVEVHEGDGTYEKMVYELKDGELQKVVSEEVEEDWGTD